MYHTLDALKSLSLASGIVHIIVYRDDCQCQRSESKSKHTRGYQHIMNAFYLDKTKQSGPNLNLSISESVHILTSCVSFDSFIEWILDILHPVNGEGS